MHVSVARQGIGRKKRWWVRFVFVVDEPGCEKAIQAKGELHGVAEERTSVPKVSI